VSLELLDALRLFRLILILIRTVVGIELVVRVTGQLKEASLARALLILLIVLMN